MATVAVAIALAAAGMYYAARRRYGQTVPFTGRAHLALLSHQEARICEEAFFAEFKKEKARKILSSSHPHAVRVRRIAHQIIRAAPRGLALWQSKAARTSRCPQEVLQWMNMLKWEVIVVVDDEAIHAQCYPGAGKIIVYTGLLHHFGKDAEIAVSLAHEIGHVMARHTSGIYHWQLKILEDMPIMILLLFTLAFLYKIPLILPFQRRCEELEADHIGIMLIAAAGIDPHNAVLVEQRIAEIEQDYTLKEYLTSTHPTSKERCEYLLQPKVMDEAMELYKQFNTTAPLPSRRRTRRRRQRIP